MSDGDGLEPAAVIVDCRDCAMKAVNLYVDGEHKGDVEAISEQRDASRKVVRGHTADFEPLVSVSDLVDWIEDRMQILENENGYVAEYTAAYHELRNVKTVLKELENSGEGDAE